MTSNVPIPLGPTLSVPVLFKVDPDPVTSTVPVDPGFCAMVVLPSFTTPPLETSSVPEPLPPTTEFPEERGRNLFYPFSVSDPFTFNDLFTNRRRSGIA
jgi:hypothetical protein